MHFNRRLALAITFASAGLTFALARAAILHNAWEGFAFSMAHMLLVAVITYLALRHHV